MHSESQPSASRSRAWSTYPCDGVQRAHRVADGSLRVLARPLHGGDRPLHVPDVVERVEDAEDVHPVVRGLGHEPVDDIVAVVPVPEQVLPAQQHLGARVRQQPAEGPQPLPRVLVEEPDAGVEGRAAPALGAPVARGVDVGAGGGHVLESHPGGHQALVGITQGQFRDIDGAVHACLLAGVGSSPARPYRAPAGTSTIPCPTPSSCGRKARNRRRAARSLRSVARCPRTVPAPYPGGGREPGHNARRSRRPMGPPPAAGGWERLSAGCPAPPRVARGRCWRGRPARWNTRPSHAEG